MPHFHEASKYFQQNKWDSTLVYSMKYLSSANIKKSPSDYCHFFRGYCFKKKKLLKEAQKELNLITEKFDFFYLVQMLLGEIYLEQQNFKNAIPYFLNVLDLDKNEGYYYNRSAVIDNLGLCYLHLRNYSKAETYLLKSVQYQEKNRDTLKLIGTLVNIASLYYEQYKDDLAIPYFKKAYDLSKATDEFNSKRTTAKNMAVVEENRKDLKKALAYRKEFEKWNDSLNDQNKIWAVAQLEKEFAVKQKQKEVSLLQAENKLKEVQRNRFLWATVVLLVLCLVVVYFYREKSKNQ